MCIQKLLSASIVKQCTRWRLISFVAQASLTRVFDWRYLLVTEFVVWLVRLFHCRLGRSPSKRIRWGSSCAIKRGSGEEEGGGEGEAGVVVGVVVQVRIMEMSTEGVMIWEV